MPGRQGHQIIPNKDGSVTVQYQPSEAGVHEVALNVNDKALEGTPFRCVVDAVSGGYITAYGQGLNFAASGQEASFSVVGGSKDVSIDIKGPSKTDVSKKEQKNGVTEVTFLPMTPGEYLIEIKANKKHIHGSPFSCKVSGEGRKRSQISIPATSEVGLGGKEVDLANMQGVLKTPAGSSEPCLLKKMPTGVLGIASFQPHSKGTYEVLVTRDGKQVSGSPFKLNVGDIQVCQAQHVKHKGATNDAIANQWNNIELDVSTAGYGGLGVSVEGAHRSDLELKPTKQPGQYVLGYKPHEPGIYLVNVRFGDDHIAGSPFMVSVGGEPSGRVRTSVNKDVASVTQACIGSACEFQLKIPGTDPLDMEATLTAPSAKSELCEIRDLPEALYDIKFKPWEEGVHTVSLKHKGLHISGSPFQYTVGVINAGGSHKVEIGGTGLEKGEVKIKNEFNIYTREAGAGKMSVIVEGPSEAVMDVVDRGHGYTTVSYIVTKPGEYGIHVKYDGEHVPDSPNMVYIVPDSADAKKVTIHGLRDRGLDLGKPATFHLNLNGGRGEVHGHMDTPSGAVEDIFIQELDRDMHAVRFTPKENGIFYVHIKLNEGHIPGSPFPMLVGQLGADPALVLCKGDGIEKGVAGKPAKFVVVTTNAGHGTLNVSIEGPSRCAIICTEVDEGYEFAYTPLAPGKYLINVKFCNVTIAGCPTRATITGTGKVSEILETSGLCVETVEKKEGAVKKKRFTGDASKVVSKGNGLKKAFVNRTNTYTIDVKDAGNAMLTIGIISPTGMPVEELTYKKTRPTVYTVNYRVKEKGEHQMFIRWGNDDVPGSPAALSVS